MSYGAKTIIRLLVLGGVLIATGLSLGLLAILWSAEEAYHPTPTVATVEPFPVGVDMQQATITEQLAVDDFYQQHLATAEQHTDRWWSQLAAVLQTNQLFQQLASPVGRLIVVWPGERTAQSAANIGAVLRWNQQQTAEFVSLLSDNELQFAEGFVLPGRYVTHRGASPADIAHTLQAAHHEAISSRYSPDVAAAVPLDQALIVASLIEREASDFANMREVSGVIWNRLFIDMPLQLDASLQYARATTEPATAWWPAVRPADKFIDSPFNTYQNTGLPPAPIANPSLAAVVAALNPRVTTCLYYFHAEDGSYHCSDTYDAHVAKLRARYGRGR